MKSNIYDVAKKANISYSSVSRILNSRTPHRYSKETVERVKKIAQELNYQRHFFASSLRSGKSNIIAVAPMWSSTIANFDMPYAAGIYNGLARYLATHNYQLVFQQFDMLEQYRQLPELVKSGMVDGLVCILFSEDLVDFQKEKAQFFHSLNIPLVLVHSLQEGLGFPSVGLDCTTGGKLAAEHLIKHGYEKIGFVTQDRFVPHWNNMFEGYLQALKSHHIPARNEWIYHVPEYSAQGGYQLAGQILKGRDLPRAFLVVEDSFATGMMARFREEGWHIPRDAAFIGFGDLVNPQHTYTELTSVQQPAEEKGREAGRLLLEILDGSTPAQEPRTLVLQPTLTVRQSCGCKK